MSTNKSKVKGSDLPDLWVLSLGAGVQSSTILLMHLEGQLGIPIQHCIFADTGWEPPAVYKHLEWLEGQLRERAPEVQIHRVGHRRGTRIQDDMLAIARGESGNYFANMPFFARDPDTGEVSILRRQCTQNYKIEPIRKKLWSLIEGKRSRRVHQIIGISVDEAHRMKAPYAKYITNHYPLVAMRMGRVDCAEWLLKNGYPVPPKSSCIGCPFHDDALWLEMREERPEEWAEAVAFDRAIRHKRGIKGTLYIHRSGVPLDEAVLTPKRPRAQQLTLMDPAVRPHWAQLTSVGMDAECAGVCGV